MGVEVLDDSGSPREAKVTGLRFLHIYANLHTRMQRLAFADVNLLAYALFASSHGYIHRYTGTGESGVLEPKERHGHSENRRAGRANKKSYPEWC